MRSILTCYAVSWFVAFVANAFVELSRLRADGRPIPRWLDMGGFVLTAWIVAPLLPVIGVVMALAFGLKKPAPPNRQAPRIRILLLQIFGVQAAPHMR